MTKKVKDKIDIGWIIMFICLIGMTILAVGIVYVVITEYNQPQFTIYKNECRNETFFELGVNEICSCKEEYSENILCNCSWDDSNYYIKSFNVSSEVCELKEVGEMINFKSMYVTSENVTISKQDLTTEWLGENCECINWCDYELYRNPLCYNSKEESWKDRDKIDKLICSKYSCNDYIIEVKK